MKTPKYTAEKIFALALSGLAPMLATAQTGTYPDADEGKEIESTPCLRENSGKRNLRPLNLG